MVTQAKRGIVPVALGIFLATLLLLPIGLPQADAQGFTVSVTATPSTGTAPLTVGFQATVSSGTPTSYRWSFGDGTFLNGSSAADASPSHVFGGPGAFVVNVTVIEATASGTGSVSVSVNSGPLLVGATAGPRSGRAPLTVGFNGTVSGGSETYVSFEWAFGTGDVGSGLSVRYTYATPGDYPVSFTATDSDGKNASAHLWVNVSGNGSAPSQPTGIVAEIWPWVLVPVAGLGIVLGCIGLLFRGRGARPDQRSSAPALSEPPSGALLTTPSAPIAGAPTAGSSVGADVLRLSQRIVIHLGQLPRIGTDELGSPAFTQAGMAEVLSVRQNVLTNVLRRLVAAGILQEDVRHVTGRSRRLKVYRLTARGESLARAWKRPRSGPP